MAIPVSYSYRNLWTRKVTTIVTMLGISLVVFVFSAVLMLAYGLKKTLVATGSDQNVVVTRKSSESDVTSQVARESANLVETFPQVAHTPDGRPLATRDVVVIINLTKYSTNDMGNVIVRGVSPDAELIRPQVKLLQGQYWQRGTTQIIVGRSIAERFRGCKLGDTIKFGSREWLVVGIFEANKTGFESEIWCDVDQMMAAFGRPVYSTVTLKLRNAQELKSFQARFAEEPRLQELEARNEREYFAAQSKNMGDFIRYLGLVITIIFSFGAMIGAMITMYASVSNRTTEIGTLRALGFQRRNILTAFLMESLLLSLIGGALGLFLASFLQSLTISTLNFATFSELAFGFYLNSSIVVWSMVFSAVMGVVGGFLPAVRASRMNIVSALRAS
jgi:putative ABC transport system permease protein